MTFLVEDHGILAAHTSAAPVFLSPPENPIDSDRLRH